jgi:hypothetical protein
MNAGPIPGGENVDDRAWRQHVNLVVPESAGRRRCGILRADEARRFFRTA